MNDPASAENGRRQDKPRHVPTVSTALPTGDLVEMVYDAEERQTGFVLGSVEGWRREQVIDTQPAERLVPYAPTNNLLAHDVVLFPTEPVEYGTEFELLARIREFIHRYVDLSAVFEELTAYYVMLSWLYDRYHELPYLRVRGDYGSGKTRFLLVVGAICYKPMFASGASTTSPLFRIIDAFRGTLILDESDFRLSDERAEIVKILNNGNARGFPVLRTEVNRSKEFDPRAYVVFGPKIIATRGYFEDRALESRCLTEDMGSEALRDDVPLNLNDRYKEEALALRNQLLLFRLRHHRDPVQEDSFQMRGVEPRLRQIFMPFYSLVDDSEARGRMTELLKRYQRDLVADRSLQVEARLLEVIRSFMRMTSEPVQVSDIARELANRYGGEFDRPVTAKWVGVALRKRLGLKPWKSRGVFVLGARELTRLPALLEKYGIDNGDMVPANEGHGDVDDVGNHPTEQVKAASEGTAAVGLATGDALGERL